MHALRPSGTYPADDIYYDDKVFQLTFFSGGALSDFWKDERQ